MTGFRRITSRQNEVVARYRAAARGGEDQMLLLDGEHLIAEALAAGLPLDHVMVASDAAAGDDIARLLDRLPPGVVDIALASPSVMSAVSPVRTPSAIVALAFRPPITDPFAARPPLVVIACDVQDPGNLGAIVRVGEAAGASGLVSAGASANPFGWKALRGSMGSALRLPIVIVRRADEAVAEARRRGCRIVATVPRGGRALASAALTGPLAILIGGEGPGLNEEVIDTADERITIPMQPPVESLNASVSAALVLYEALRQRIVPNSDFRIQNSELGK